MATRIDIRIGQALLMDRLRGIAGLNREQRLERERQAKEQAQIKAAADKASAERAKAGAETDADKAKRKSGVPEYYTPPKVAATGQTVGVKLAWCWTRRTSSTSTENPAVNSYQGGSSINIGPYYRAPEKRTYLIVSGDGSATLSVDLTMPESAAVRSAAPADYSTSYYEWFTPGSTVASNFVLRSRLLPTGQDGVGILMLRHDYYFLSQVLGYPTMGSAITEFYRAEYVGRGIGCWLVSPDAIRPLSTPAALRTASDDATTSWTIVDGTNPASVSGPYAGVPMPQQPQLSGNLSHYQPAGPYTESHGWWTFFSRADDSYGTPLEFQRLQGEAAYNPPAQTVWMEPDFVTSPGLFGDYWGGGSGLLEWGDAINLKNPMRWGGRAYPRTGVPVTQAQGELSLLPRLKRDMSAIASVPPRSGSNLYGIQVCHDYGDRAACRRDLFALGFTPADLQP
jgi:hypothetical protein